MDAKKKEAIMECTSFDELLDAEYGERGTETREKFETEAETFCLAECLKEQRRGNHGDRYCFKNQTFWIKSEAF